MYEYIERVRGQWGEELMVHTDLHPVFSSVEFGMIILLSHVFSSLTVFQCTVSYGVYPVSRHKGHANSSLHL